MGILEENISEKKTTEVLWNRVCGIFIPDCLKETHGVILVYLSNQTRIGLESGQELSEVKTEFFILLKLSGERKKYLMDSITVQVPKSSIEEQQNKLMVEEEKEISRVKATVIRKKRKHSWFQNIKGCNCLSFFHFQNDDKQLNNIYMKEETEEKVPKSSIEEQQNKLTVKEEEEISRVKPTVIRKKRKHSWFLNIKGCNFLSFFHFQNHDKQLNNIYMKEENEVKVSFDFFSSSPILLHSQFYGSAYRCRSECGFCGQYLNDHPIHFHDDICGVFGQSPNC
ncbi:uncharacterized protein LOC141505161 [Macrotis lagotis]|uniref:uncharacterized protein LOC141505161 n=1 Tax=Macrotis lagotis TaxID=92651 RepID=UPI003D6851F2